MSNLKRQLTLLTSLIMLLMAIILLAPAFYLWWPADFAFYAPHAILEDHGGTEALTGVQQALVLALLEWPALFLCAGLLHLLALIRLIKREHWFDRACEHHCKRFGHFMAWFIFAQITHRTLVVLVITLSNPVGERQLVLQLSSSDLFAALPALFALVFAQLVSLGRAQQDELKEII